MTILVTLTSAGTSTTLFNLYSNLNYVTPLVTGITRATLLAGYYLNSVPDSATSIRVTGTGVCTNSIDIAISGLTTTTSTSSTSSTSTSSTTSTTTAPTTSSSTSTSTSTTTSPTTSSSTTTSTTTAPTTSSSTTTSTTTTTTTAAPTYYLFNLCDGEGIPSVIVTESNLLSVGMVGLPAPGDTINISGSGNVTGCYSYTETTPTEPTAGAVAVDWNNCSCTPI